MGRYFVTALKDTFGVAERGPIVDAGSDEVEKYPLERLQIVLKVGNGGHAGGAYAGLWCFYLGFV